MAKIPEKIIFEMMCRKNYLPMFIITILSVITIDSYCGISFTQAFTLYPRQINHHSLLRQKNQLSKPIIDEPFRISSYASSCTVCQAKKSKEDYLQKRWLPSSILQDSAKHNHDDGDEDASTTITTISSTILQQDWERMSIAYLGLLIKTQLSMNRYGDKYEPNIHAALDEYNHDNQQENPISYDHEEMVKKIVKGHFRDLTSSNPMGEESLERMFSLHAPELPSLSLQSLEEEVASIIIKGAVVALQSLLILGTQVGLKGSPLQQERFVSHLDQSKDDSLYGIYNRNSNNQYIQNIDDNEWDHWDNKSIRQLKHRIDITAGIQVLAELKRKRSSQSAFDLLVQLRIWTIHEDLPLLRSGFPISFTSKEQSVSWEAELSKHDADELLGIRQDLRHLKVYTIDGPSTLEIDDGLSVERISNDENEPSRYRLWIHIADADKWAPRNSAIFDVAQQRATSVYLPSKTVSMFPPNLSTGAMSLRSDCDSYALSLSVELNTDGSIDEQTIRVMPSIISVNYRLSYDEVDEMFEYGAAYFEEWELGVLLDQAKIRRQFRISNGSTEGFVPTPIPQAEIKARHNSIAKDEVEITLELQVTHNSGSNHSSVVALSDDDSTTKGGNGKSNSVRHYLPPISSAYLLVTEMMIMAGEAMGKYKTTLPSIDPSSNEDNSDDSTSTLQLMNTLELPYRTQGKADFAKRYQELDTLESLRHRGDGYCHAWYARRFFEPVRVLLEPRPHTGLGLDCYVQWTSPIRRFSDLQVHAAVKRYLRIERVNELMRDGKDIPHQLRNTDLGYIVPRPIEPAMNEGEDDNNATKVQKYTTYEQKEDQLGDYSIDYKRGAGFVNAARMVQRFSKEYWLFEYIQRMMATVEDLVFEVTVLACVDPKRLQYVIYVHELGLEHRYLSEKGTLRTGETMWLKVASVSPRQALLTFTLAPRQVGA